MPTSNRAASSSRPGLAALLLLLGSCVSRVEFPAPVKLLGPFVNQTANLAGMASACGDLLTLAVRPDEDELIVGVVQRGLYHQPAGATDWQPLGTGSGSDSIENDPYSIVFDPAHPGTFWESGIHSTHGVYVTHDAGQTFHYSPGSQNNDLVSIDFSDPARSIWLAGVHESGVHVQLSTDAGASWTDLGSHLFVTVGDTSWPLVQSATTWLLGSNNGTTPGIFRTTDAGATWTKVSKTPVHSRPLVAKDGTIYWMAETSGGVVSSVDQGVTWSAPLAPGDTRATVSGLAELPSGRLLATGAQYLLISSDHAQSWTPLAQQPFTPFGLAYSSARKLIYLWHNDCATTGDVVLADAVVALPFDDQTQ